MTPRFLYKYQKYFIETKDKINYTKRIIRDNEFYYPIRSELNDPFEFRFSIYEGSNLVKGANESKEFEKEIFNNFGILSLTTKKDDIIMFSHYADKHTGICLEFDTTKDENIFKEKPFEVNYRESVPSFQLKSFIHEKGNPKFIEPIFSTKYCSWHYEKEWRILYHVSSKNDHRIEKYRPEALTGIIFGCESDDEIKNEIKEIVKFKNHKIILYQAYRKKEAYGLDIIPVN